MIKSAKDFIFKSIEVEMFLKFLIDKMTNHDDNHLQCSFCGKTQYQVKKLIAGPEVYICNECVELCKEILDEEIGEKCQNLL